MLFRAELASSGLLALRSIPKTPRHAVERPVQRFGECGLRAGPMYSRCALVPRWPISGCRGSDVRGKRRERSRPKNRGARVAGPKSPAAVDASVGNALSTCTGWTSGERWIRGDITDRKEESGPRGVRQRRERTPGRIPRRRYPTMRATVFTPTRFDPASGHLSPRSGNSPPCAAVGVRIRFTRMRTSDVVARPTGSLAGAAGW